MRTDDPIREAPDAPGSAGQGSAYERRLRALLGEVAAGSVDPSEAAERLVDLPFADLGFARVDHHRELRQGACEIVLAEGKTPRQVGGIVRQLLDGNEGPVLVTRADRPARAAALAEAEAAGLPAEEHEDARAMAVVRNVPPPAGDALVVTAGTSDLPIAREAMLTARLLGAGVELLADVGVAGLHRLAAVRDRIREADVVVVMAGMEGALASVTGGIATGPVIACPTSVGYGASFGGLAALLAMLSSCTPGVLCVNIDDGVGAGYAAALIARRSGGPSNRGA
jgi:pyridinium-3,5-biscarboxylic acid mononucleotide synthase